MCIRDSLEDEELIAAPHTSSGRVPTDKGYRVFVDHLAQLRPLSVAQRTAIESFLTAPSDLDDLMVRTVRVLTQLTGQVALAQYPSFARAHLTHLELVALAPNRLLIVLVTDAGGVSQRIAPLPVDVDDADMALLRARLSALITGRAVSDAAERLQTLLTDDEHSHDIVLRALATIVIDELGAFRQERLVMAGAATLAKREQDFRGSIHPILEAIEEQVTLLRLMSEMEADSHGLAASIGTENASFGLGEASIVASNYAAPSGTARVGVMGPTRMDYPSNLAAARAVARYLSRMLDEDEAAR